MLLSQRSRRRKTERKKRAKRREKKGNNKRRNKTKRETSATKQKTGFKIMNMAVRHFHVFEVFWGQLEVKICKILGDKNAYFCRKEAKVGQMSPPSMEGGDL